MSKYLYVFATAALGVWAGCRPEPPESIPLPTSICVRTLHHTWPIPACTVYVKYFADSFPGYKRPRSYFDAMFITDGNGRGCINGVPEGRHWLIGIGYDSLYYPYDVFGNLPVHISLDEGRGKVDTILYVTEEH
jgi:hypothetical protein